MKKEINNIATEIVAYAGEARSFFVLALRCNQQKKNLEAKTHYKDGQESLNKAHKIQFSLLAQEAKGEKFEVSLLMVHAQDILMSAELLKDLTKELMQIN